MGVVVRFRGRLEDFSQLEPLEDRVVDLALDLGGQARIWRSSSNADRRRAVRGVLWDIAPGAETFPLLFSPEGWLLPLPSIEDAEAGKLKAPPWVSVKTQFASPKAHVALIETLAEVREGYVPDLEVDDEGGYWETRDLEGLLRRRGAVEKAIDGLARALRNATPDPASREDPGILADSVAQLAEKVHRTLRGPSEHPPAMIAGDESPWSDDPGTEAEWDAIYAEQRRKQERMHRSIEEAVAGGADPGAAFDRAIEAEGIGLPDPFASDGDDPAPPPFDFEPEPEGDGEDLPEPPPLEKGRREEEHPLQKKARDLILRVVDVRKASGVRGPDSLLDVESALMDVGGGLAQALGLDEEDDEVGWSLVQLKRALRGAAFARGALFRARGEGRLAPETFDEILDGVGKIEGALVDEVRAARGRL